ncbi:hypothetical protein EVAR_29506_1 [Eumeta japonica]|uniref:Uncharacterized protein n=1 Tax=Eumeta variegata TaxID=151549 RepID=A0A4C1WFM6_EUMVA|nr:hypothetical protein EVAR_29506_1 [Eumeta japonica]
MPLPRPGVRDEYQRAAHKTPCDELRLNRRVVLIVPLPRHTLPQSFYFESRGLDPKASGWTIAGWGLSTASGSDGRHALTDMSPLRTEKTTSGGARRRRRRRPPTASRLKGPRKQKKFCLQVIKKRPCKKFCLQVIKKRPRKPDVADVHEWCSAATENNRCSNSTP